MIAQYLTGKNKNELIPTFAVNLSSKKIINTILSSFWPDLINLFCSLKLFPIWQINGWFWVKLAVTIPFPTSSNRITFLLDLTLNV